jgi:hypothetical protein
MKIYRLIDAILTILVLCLFTIPIVTGFSTPTGIFGYVKMDGSPIGGAAVTLSDGQSATTDASGYYIFASGVDNGSSYTITATSNGLSTSNTFTAHGDRMQIDLSLSSPAPTHTGDTIAYAGQPTPTSNAEPSTNETSSQTSVDKQSVTEQSSAQEPIESSEGSSIHDMQGESEESSLHVNGFLNLFQFVAGLIILGALSGIGYYILWRAR